KIDYRGTPVYLGPHGDYAMFSQSDIHSFVYRELAGGSRRAWLLEFPAGSNYSLQGDGSMVLVNTAGDIRAVAWLFGEFTPAMRARDISLTAMPTALKDGLVARVTRDGRYPLLIAGANIEVVDLAPPAGGAPTSRTMNLEKDDELQVA